MFPLDRIIVGVNFSSYSANLYRLFRFTVSVCVRLTEFNPAAEIVGPGMESKLS